MVIQARRQLLLTLSGLLHEYLSLGSVRESIPENSEDALASMGSCQLLTCLVLFICYHVLSITAWYSHINLGYSYFIDLLHIVLSFYEHKKICLMLPCFTFILFRSVNNFLMTGPKVIDYYNMSVKQ